MSPARSGDVPPIGWQVNRKAALKEAGPSLAKVMRERPGSETDRAQQEFHREANRAAASAAHRSRVERRRADEEDADRFIAAMRRKAHDELLARAASWRERTTEKRTA